MLLKNVAVNKAFFNDVRHAHRHKLFLSIGAENKHLGKREQGPRPGGKLSLVGAFRSVTVFRAIVEGEIDGMRFRDERVDVDHAADGKVLRGAANVIAAVLRESVQRVVVGIFKHEQFEKRVRRHSVGDNVLSAAHQRPGRVPESFGTKLAVRKQRSIEERTNLSPPRVARFDDLGAERALHGGILVGRHGLPRGCVGVDPVCVT